MDAPQASEPTKCSACGAVAVRDGVCSNCGSAFGETNRCPHCRAVARVEPKGHGAEAAWVCAACGGPRMPGGLGAQAALTPLREAKASLDRATRARARVWGLALMAFFFTLIALAAWPAGLVVKLLVLAAALTPTVLALRARSEARHAKGDADEALTRAWLAAAQEAAAESKNGVTVAELAARLKIDEAKAERLLTQLSVHEQTRIDVGDDAEVRYSVAPEIAVPRVRVDATEAKFQALEQAEAQAEIDAEEAKKLATPAFPTRGSSR